MIIIDWKCDECGYEQQIVDDSDEPLCINEVIEFTCVECGEQYELAINRP